MEMYITDEHTGLNGDDEPDPPSIGIWGKRHLQYLKQHRRGIYLELQMNGDLPGYLADLDRQAEEMYSRLVKQLAEQCSISVTLKAENQRLCGFSG